MFTIDVVDSNSLSAVGDVTEQVLFIDIQIGFKQIELLGIVIGQFEF